MQIEINNAIYTVPSNVADIKLGTFIDWTNQYGKAFDEELKVISLNDALDSHTKELLIDSLLDNEAAAWFSFHTGHDFNELMQRDTQAILAVIYSYKNLRYLLKTSELEAYNFPNIIEFNNEEWRIQDFKVDAKSSMTFNEIITSKEALRQIQSLGLGMWDGMPYLCAMFLRKKDEPFKDEFLFEDSERLLLMHQLPLNYAFAVAFFLSSCVHICSTTSAYLGQAAAEIPKQN